MFVLVFKKAPLYGLLGLVLRFTFRHRHGFSLPASLLSSSLIPHLVYPHCLVFVSCCHLVSSMLSCSFAAVHFAITAYYSVHLAVGGLYCSPRRHCLSLSSHSLSLPLPPIAVHPTPFSAPLLYVQLEMPDLLSRSADSPDLFVP